MLQGAAIQLTFGYVAVQHPIPGVGVLFMIWTHCVLVMFVPVVAMDIDAEVTKRKPNARVSASARPIAFELMSPSLAARYNEVLPEHSDISIIHETGPKPHGMRWLDASIVALFIFSVVTSLLAVLQVTVYSGVGPLAPVGTNPSLWDQLFLQIRQGSTYVAPLGWVGLVSMWIWRGHTKSRWERLGYDKDAFQLMTKMRGAATRLRLLESLDTPMDRYQLASRLGLDWKSIDRQTEVLGRFGLIREQEAYGRVKMYSITENGRTMLKLVRELDEKSS